MPDPDHPDDDEIDAEFTELDVDKEASHHRTPRSKSKQSKEWGSILLLVCLIGGGVYWLFGRGDSKQNIEPGPPGWFELLDCFLHYVV